MSELLHGGRADSIPPDAFPTKKLREGMKVEREHSSNRKVTEEIAKDHLSEDMAYYEKLKKMEKTAKGEAIFDELLTISEEITKTSAPLSGKGALIGGGIGTGFGALRALGREAHERAADDRARLTDPEKKALRKKRLAGHAANILAWGGAGAGLGAAHKKVGETAGKMAKSIRENVQPQMNQFIRDTGPATREVIGDGMLEAAEGIPARMAVGAAKLPWTAAKAVGRGAKNLFGRLKK
jgi:hypothetical protein